MFILGLVLITALILISSARSEIFEGEIPSIIHEEVELIDVNALHCDDDGDFIVGFSYNYINTPSIRAVELFLSSDLKNKIMLFMGVPEDDKLTIFVRVGQLVQRFEGWDAFETAYPSLCEINFNNET